MKCDDQVKEEYKCRNHRTNSSGNLREIHGKSLQVVTQPSNISNWINRSIDSLNVPNPYLNAFISTAGKSIYTENEQHVEST